MPPGKERTAAATTIPTVCCNFAILNSNGAIITSATDISQDTAAYNCYSETAELSNGNIAFLYQRAGDHYQLRIFNPYGTAMTGPITVT